MRRFVLRRTLLSSNIDKTRILLILLFVVIASPTLAISYASTTLTLYPVADSYVTEWHGQSSNFGGQPRLRVADFSEGSVTYRVISYIMFDLSSIPKDATVEKAELKLQTYVGIPETFTVGVNYCSNNSWEELTINWNNRPSYDASSWDSLPVAAPNVWYTWSEGTTEIVKKAFATSSRKLTIVLTPISKSHSDSPMEFYSKDSISGKEEGPKLVITYSEKPQYVCLIATATYGSELSPEVQCLRGFREDIVLKTFTGGQFMAVFNSVYYSFSPTVAASIASSEVLRGLMKIILYPLMGILHLGVGAYSLFSFSPDLGIFAFCLVVSSLMSIVYLAPWALLYSFLKKNVISTKKIRTVSFVWIGSIATIVVAELSKSAILMMASGGLFVLATSCLAVFVTTRVIMERRIHGIP